MVGETLDVGNQICGAVVSRRKAGDKIALWNRTAEKDIYEALGSVPTFVGSFPF